VETAVKVFDKNPRKRVFLCLAIIQKDEARLRRLKSISRSTKEPPLGCATRPWRAWRVRAGRRLSRQTKEPAVGGF
jgi:hypothetical protein